MRSLAFVIAAAAVVAAAGAAGCTEPRSAPCTQVCKREAECLDELNSKLPFNVNECIAACAALEQDQTVNGAKVKRHIECVNRQPTCAGVLECK